MEIKKDSKVLPRIGALREVKIFRNYSVNCFFLNNWTFCSLRFLLLT